MRHFTLASLVAILFASTASAQVLINEIDSDTPGTDTAEFIELYAESGAATSLDGYVLVFYNGNAAADAAYSVFDLDGFTTDAAGYIVFGEVAGASADTPNAIQNGPDGVALFLGNASDFTTGATGTPASARPVGTTLIDAIVYSTGENRDEALLTALGQSVQFDEGYGGADIFTSSVGRLNGVSTTGPIANAVSGLFYTGAPTAGLANPSTILVDVTEQVDGTDGDTDNADRGWRQLAMPGFESDGTVFEVADLVGINLIQGVPGGTAPAQYPAAFPNIFTSVDGVSTGDATNGYNAPVDMDEQMLPGAGFMWYFYDQAFGPLAGGTSQSYELTDGFSLTTNATPADDRLNGGTPYGLLSQPVEPYIEVATKGGANVTRFYMIGNPMGYAYPLGAITMSGNGSLQTNFYVWDPNISTTLSQGQTIQGSYTVLVADQADPRSGDILGRWNGAFAEATVNSAFIAPETFSFPSGSVSIQQSEAFIGKAAASGRLALRLEGVTESGQGVVDVAAMIRMEPDATVEWDRHDGTKLTSMSETYALLAPVGVMEDVRRRQSVVSVPSALAESTSIPVDFMTTEAGTFIFGWDLSQVPTGWSAMLLDTETGAEVDFGSSDTYQFTATAGDWTERFVITLSPASVVATEPSAETGLSLSAPMPNPASGVARVILTAGTSQPVFAAVYDALGRQVTVLHDGPLATGQKTLTLDTTTLAPGVYIVRAQGESGAMTQRLTVTR